MAEINIVVTEEIVNIVEVGVQGPVGPTGAGDMQKSVYDLDDSGVVDEAEGIDGGSF